MDEREFRERLVSAGGHVPPPQTDLQDLRRRGHRRAARTIAAAVAAVALVTAGVSAVALSRVSRPGRPVAPPTGASPCEGEGMRLATSYGTPRSFTEYPTTVRNLEKWLAERHGPDGPGIVPGPSDRLGDDPVTVCVYRGEFHVAKGPPPPATPQAQRVLSIIVTLDGARLDSVGASFRWAYTPAPPGCHQGEKGCDALGLCAWSESAPLPCGRGVEPGRAYAYRLWTHCGIRQAWFDGRLWEAQTPAEPRRDLVDGEMTLIDINEAVLRVPGMDPVVFRAEPKPSPQPCY